MSCETELSLGIDQTNVLIMFNQDDFTVNEGRKISRYIRGTAACQQHAVDVPVIFEAIVDAIRQGGGKMTIHFRASYF